MSKPTSNGDDDTKTCTNEESMSLGTQADANMSLSASDSIDPIFMDRLPGDFATNPTLLAIASLIANDDVREQEQEGSTSDRGQPKQDVTTNLSLSRGGGKVRIHHRQGNERVKPYDLNQIERSQSSKTSASTTVPEAQLFLSLWKL